MDGCHGWVSWTGVTDRFEVFFGAHRTVRTHKVLRQRLKGGAGGISFMHIPLLFIVGVIAAGAAVCTHGIAS